MRQAGYWVIAAASLKTGLPKRTESGPWHVGTWCPTEPTCVARARGQESGVQGHEVTEAAETWAQGASETTVKDIGFSPEGDEGP